MVIDFVVYGSPKGKARPRFTKSGAVYTPKATKDYENMIRQSYIGSGGISFGEQAVTIQVVAEFERAKSNKRSFAIIKPDLDNIIKAVLDGLNGIAFNDDKQVVEIRAKKRYCNPGGTPALAVRVITDAE